MRLPVLLVLAAALAGCGTTRDDPRAEAFDGAIVATAFGTPVYAVTKATVCVASALIGGPSSALVALTDRRQRDWQRQALHEGIGYNCRGPYWLEPIY